jgi:uncharacterized protein involved in exopolysaccharide biosynthesis
MEQSNQARGGERMNRAAHSAAREVALQDVAVAAGPHDELIALETRGPERAPVRAMAAQRLVWKHRQFLFRFMTAGLAMSALIALLIPNRYRSTARLMPPDQGGSSAAMLAAAGSRFGVDLGSGLAGLGGDLLGLKSTSDLFLGILQSRTVQDAVIGRMELKKVYADRRMEDARDDLSKNTNLSADRKSGIITIQVVDKSPARAAAIAGEYVVELDQVVTSLNTSSAHRERVFLEDRLAQVKRDLESAEKNFSEFAGRNTALDVPTQGKAMIEAAATLEGQLIAVETDLEGLKQVYADGNIRVRSAQARVDELRRQMEKNLGGKPGDAAGEKEPARKSLYPTIRDLTALGVGYADMYRSTKIEEAVFQTLTQEYELAKVQEAKETPSVKILDPPNIPEKKFFPPGLLIIFLGTILALSGGILLILGNALWQSLDPRDEPKALALEVLEAMRARLAWAQPGGAGVRLWSRLRPQAAKSDSAR